MTGVRTGRKETQQFTNDMVIELKKTNISTIRANKKAQQSFWI